MDPEQERAFDFVVSLRDVYIRYHADKEREAYATAALYLAATAAGLARTDPLTPIIRAGLGGATVLAVVLVAFQLYYRWFAARIVAASTTVASQWLRNAPDPADYQPTPLHGTLWPAAVVHGFHAQHPLGPWAALMVIPAVLLLWGALVICPALQGRIFMHLELWLNAIGLVFGVIAAFLLAIYRLPAESFVTDTGRRKLEFDVPPTPQSIREAWVNRVMARLGAGLLGLAFLLQLAALLLPILCR